MSELNERLIIASLSTPERIIHLGKREVKIDDFLFHKDKIKFVFTYYQKYKEVPTPTVLASQFEGYEPAYPDFEAIDFYIDELKRDKLERRITEELEKSIPLIRSDPAAAAKAIQASMAQLEIKEGDVSHTDKEAMKRLEWYEERRLWRKKGHITGVPTGLRYFQDKGEGFNFGNVVTVVGQTWVGKSWLMLFMALNAYLAGFRVLLISCEMTAEEEEVRFDALLAALKNTPLPYKMLKSGAGDLQERYASFLEELAGRDEWKTLDAADLPSFEMEDIVRRVDEFKPDVVAIDGMEFLQDTKTRGRSGWEEVKSIIRQAKLLAVSRNVVVLATAQATFKDGPENRMPKMKDIAYSSDIVRASDVMISMAKPDEDEAEAETLRYYTVQKERNGSGHIRRIKLRFDPAGTGEISEIREQDNPDYEVA